MLEYQSLKPLTDFLEYLVLKLGPEDFKPLRTCLS